MCFQERCCVYEQCVNHQTTGRIKVCVRGTYTQVSGAYTLSRVYVYNLLFPVRFGVCSYE